MDDTPVFELADPSGPDARWALGRYFAELDARFSAGFVPEEGGADGDAAALRPPRGAFILMVSDAATIGCGGVQRVDGDTGEIKRMWVEPAWRGRGLGRRLLTRLEDEAVALGHRRVLLDTNATLEEAIGLYEASGYRSIERYNRNPYAQRWFEKVLVGD